MSQQVKSLSAIEAWQICQKDPRTLLIDVRSSMEYLFVGHPQGAIHIPWIDEPDWVINKNFATEIRKLGLGGLQDIYNIDEGFEGKLDEAHHRSSVGGWRFRDLPWEQC
jgi:rhodanese-related sulfurtransferase